MALVLGADHHNFAVPFDDLALIAHRLYRRSNFHNCLLVIFFTNFSFGPRPKNFVSLRNQVSLAAFLAPTIIGMPPFTSGEPAFAANVVALSAGNPPCARLLF